MTAETHNQLQKIIYRIFLFLNLAKIASTYLESDYDSLMLHFVFGLIFTMMHVYMTDKNERIMKEETDS